MIQNTRLKPIAINQHPDVTINVTVGNGQSSSTSIYKNGKLLYSQNNTFSFQLNAQIDDEVNIVTTVSDLPQNPNRIVVTHTIMPQNVTVDFDNKVDEGELAINTSRFDFY